jgi:DUF1680 family protein
MSANIFQHALPACLALLFILPNFGLLADVPQAADPTAKVAPQIPIRAFAFGLQDVRLLDGPFLRARQLDAKYLLSLDVDQLLHNFRLNAGLASTAKPLGGWEEPKCEVRGHFVGHYLSACALMYASTGDQEFQQRAERLVAGLAECQAKLGNGYLSAYPEEFIDRVEAQQRVWAPYYTLHKIYAGLLDVFVHCGNQQALEVCRRFADWVMTRNARLTDEQMQQMLGNEHGGMNEVLANLYGVTGDARHLQISLRFNHQTVIGPASRHEDKLTGLHANTQIPKFVGTARQYELTGDESLRAAADFFWNTVVHERSYVIGGHSDGEAFSPKERLSEALGPNTTETCNTYNMLKLTRHLFCWTASAEYADYYERALVNHILCSQNPDSGMMCYYVPLRSGSHKAYNEPLDSFWCCTGTGVENHAKYNDSIYFHDGASRLFVNQFMASELNWKAHGLTVRQETQFPEEATSRLVFRCEKPVALALAIRHPAWATSGFELRVNGTVANVTSGPGSYAVVERSWSDGDVVQISMPFQLRTEGFRDNPRRFAFLSGPLVLCAELQPDAPVPGIVSESPDVLPDIQPGSQKPQTWIAPRSLFRALSGDDPGDVTLEPFYRLHGGRRYLVYWDQYTPEQWQTKALAYGQERERQRALAARTVDFVTPGDEANEAAHKLQGEKTGAGPFSGRFWRHAWDGGWFSYHLRVQSDQPQKLLVTYWGSDSGNRVFDLLIDGTKVATQRLNNSHPDQFFDETYAIPQELTRGKSTVTVRFQAHPGAIAGGIFDCRIVN